MMDGEAREGYLLFWRIIIPITPNLFPKMRNRDRKVMGRSCLEYNQIDILNNMSDKRPIGAFDSGVGGLSVLKELHKLLPKEDFIFIADQAHVPYGEKSQSQLCRLSHNVSDFLLKHGAKLIVVACNTATCHTIDYLRKKFKVPFVGTVPAVKTAAEKTVKKCIGVIS